MRQLFEPQMQFGQVDIPDIVLDLNSRDDIPQVLAGLQHIWADTRVRNNILELLGGIFPENQNLDIGRPGMTLWNILVMGILRLNLNWNYDRLHEMVNQHQSIRQMLGHGFMDDQHRYGRATIMDNLRRFTPAILERINHLVIQSGHDLISLKELDGRPLVLAGRCDSYVFKTHVHYPTDISLLHDAVRVVIREISSACDVAGLSDWRQYRFNLRQEKRLFNKARRLKHSSAKDEAKKKAHNDQVEAAYIAYGELSADFLNKARNTVEILVQQHSLRIKQQARLRSFIGQGLCQINQIERRVVQGEKIPHEEKIFSLHQEHTEWISKGKAGVPVEFGLRLCILEDQYGFVLHHHVMEETTDEKVAIPMVEATQKAFPLLRSCSFDKGFHSKPNQTALPMLLDAVALPKKGRLNNAEKEHEHSERFIRDRKRHSAVESAINALQVHGLDKCPDNGIEGYKRYAALGVLARNIQKLGALVRMYAKNKELPQRLLVA